MLRLKRLLVFSLFSVSLIAAFSFWATRQPAQTPAGPFLQPPRAGANPEMLSTGVTTAVNVTRSPDAQWLIRAAAPGIPARALRAYVTAAATANDSAPTCGMGWNTVAAVGSSNQRTELTTAAASTPRGRRASESWARVSTATDSPLSPTRMRVSGTATPALGPFGLHLDQIGSAHCTRSAL